MRGRVNVNDIKREFELKELDNVIISDLIKKFNFINKKTVNKNYFDNEKFLYFLYGYIEGKYR